MIISNEELFRKFEDIVRNLADVVTSTLGPKGNLVIMRSAKNQPVITKDGVTVAKHFVLEDDTDKLILDIIKQAIIKTNEEVGDGTTTTTVLLEKMIEELSSQIPNCYDQRELLKGFEQAMFETITQIEKESFIVDSFKDIEDIATIAANNDNVVGKLIAQTVEDVGKDGTIIVKEVPNIQRLEAQIVDGYRFDTGIFSNHFANKKNNSYAKYNNVGILVTDETLTELDELVPILEHAIRAEMSLVVIAPNIEEKPLGLMITNHIRKTMKVIGIKAPLHGDLQTQILSDIATLVGADFISKTNNNFKKLDGTVGPIKLSEVKIENLGHAETIESTTKGTVIIGGAGTSEAIIKRKNELKVSLEETDLLDEKVSMFLHDRIAKLSSSVGLIKVNGKTEIERIELKDRVEDAINSVYSAQKKGMITGGGQKLLMIKELLKDNFLEDKEETKKEKDFRMGYHLFLDILSSPFEKIMKNAKIPQSEIDSIKNELIQKQKENKFVVYNVSTEQFKNNAKEEGLVDPTLVSIKALENSFSVVKTLLSSNHLIL